MISLSLTKNQEYLILQHLLEEVSSLGKELVNNFKKQKNLRLFEEAEGLALISLEHRDSSLLDHSNALAIIEEIEVSQLNIKVVELSHWGVGWIKSMAFKPFQDEGLPSLELLFYQDVVARQESYPILSDRIYYALEFEEQTERFKEQIEEAFLDVIVFMGEGLSYEEARQQAIDYIYFEESPFTEQDAKAALDKIYEEDC